MRFWEIAILLQQQKNSAFFLETLRKKVENYTAYYPHYVMQYIVMGSLFVWCDWKTVLLLLAVLHLNSSD